MLFTLEALQAKKGDALLLHVGEDDDRQLVMIDGGPNGVFGQSLGPRLEAIREARTPDEELPIPLVLISHIDDDHIRGVLDLTDEMVETRESGEPAQYRIRTIWHNSFDDLVGSAGDALTAAALGEVATASVGDESLATDNVSHDGGLMLASVAQGRRVRQNADALGITLNAPLGGLVAAEGSADRLQVPGVPGLTFTVLGPPKRKIEKLQKKWTQVLPGILQREQARAQAAAYADQSVYNLASIVVLAECAGKRILLTGDCRGDDTLEAAREQGLLDDGPLHLDILKLPHHGSIRNVELDFFENFTANHYVISGNGAHGNPRVDALRLLFESRRNDPRHFTIHLTYEPEDYIAFRGVDYPVQELRDLLASETAAGTAYTLVTPATGDVSMSIDLLDRYDGA